VQPPAQLCFQLASRLFFQRGLQSLLQRVAVEGFGDHFKAAVAPPGHLVGAPLAFAPVEPHPAAEHLEHAFGAHKAFAQFGQVVEEFGELFAVEAAAGREGVALRLQTHAVVGQLFDAVAAFFHHRGFQQGDV